QGSSGHKVPQRSDARDRQCTRRSAHHAGSDYRPRARPDGTDTAGRRRGRSRKGPGSPGHFHGEVQSRTGESLMEGVDPKDVQEAADQIVSLINGRIKKSLASLYGLVFVAARSLANTSGLD